MLIVWDEPKRRSNLEKHGFDFADLDHDFFVEGVVLPAHHQRLKAVGRVDSEVLAVVFVFLGSEAISVISMRVADRGERKLWNEKTSN